MSDTTINVSVDLSPDAAIATVRLGNSAPAVCRALGVDRDSTGVPAVIYLDRFIHKSVRNRCFSGWQPSGAITTILTRHHQGQ
jgi:hypothetical protein